MIKAEKLAQKRVISLIKLYLKETPNHFTMEKPQFGTPLIESSFYRTYSYPKGYVILKDKHSPVKMTLYFKDIYKWGIWRNDKFIPMRYNYCKTAGIISNNVEDLSLTTLKHILKTLKEP